MKHTPIWIATNYTKEQMDGHAVKITFPMSGNVFAKHPAKIVKYGVLSYTCRDDGLASIAIRIGALGDNQEGVVYLDESAVKALRVDAFHAGYFELSCSHPVESILKSPNQSH